MKRIVVIAGAFVLILATFFLVRFFRNIDKTEEINITEDLVLETQIEYLYDIPVSDFSVIKGKINRNQFLGDLLYEHGVSNQQIYAISNLPEALFNERKIKAGNKYALFIDSMGVRYFIYEKDLVNYSVIHLEDSIHAELRKKPVEIRTKEAYGTVTSSLWLDFKEAGLNPMLAIELSEIYAWSIDFFGLQSGDAYKVIYEESFVDSLSIGISKVHAAWFLHNNHEFWAIPFVQDSVRSFFDEDGNSLRKAFLKAPLRFSRISSRFSNSRMHPILKIRRPHHGIDYVAPAGTPVLAVGDGQVIEAAFQARGGGNYVKIKHNGVYSTTYMHLSRFGKGIRKGVYVKQGDVIGYVGSTGLSTGPHLDFRFFRNGNAVDPLKVEAPPVEPIHEDNRIDYELVKNSMMAALREIGE
ncbi:M23 family metallopeptidase [Bacteroidota bacterium]